MYAPLLVKSPTRSLNTTTLTPLRGINIRDLPQLLKPDQALSIVNYIITGDGGLEKRGGLEPLFDAASVTPITMLEKWTDDIYIFGYANTKVAAYRKSTATITDIKTDFLTNVTGGARWGDYFFVASQQDKIGRISQTLGYDAQTANFTVGLLVTGSISGATAIILEDADGGATGTLTLGSINGTFQNNEIITDSGTGSATVNGTLTFTYTTITAAPMAKHIYASGTRLYAGNIFNDPSQVIYSNTISTNPPFDTWTVGTLATDGGSQKFGNAGAVNVITSIGTDIIVVFADEGKWAFRIDTTDSAGVLSKVDTTLMYLIDAGGFAALQTAEGIYYLNHDGLWLLVAIAQSNVKYSEQQILSSDQLGNNFFDDMGFGNSSMVSDDKRNLLLVTMAQDSAVNNFVLVLNTKSKAFMTFTGWNLGKMINDDGELFGGGATTSKVWQLLEGNDDDGEDIWYEFEQELSVGALWTRKSMEGQYVQGLLSPSSNPQIKFSIYDVTGSFIADKLELDWNYGTSGLTAHGYGESSYGDPYGGDIDFAGTAENFAGSRYRIANFQRIRVKISGHDKAKHVINWLSINTKEKIDIRRRNLIAIT